MVLARCERPLPEPRIERSHSGERAGWVAPDDRPFLARRLVGLVEDRRVDVELSHVVGQCAPRETVPLFAAQAHLLGDQIAVGPDPLGVTSRHGVVCAQLLDQREQFGRGGGLVDAFDAVGEAFGGATTERDAETRRRLVGERERQSKHRREWQERATPALDDDGRRARDDQHAAPVGRAADRLRRDERGIGAGEDERADQWREERGSSKCARSPRARLPTIRLQV